MAPICLKHYSHADVGFGGYCLLVPFLIAQRRLKKTEDSGSQTCDAMLPILVALLCRELSLFFLPLSSRMSPIQDVFPSRKVPTCGP